METYKAYFIRQWDKGGVDFYLRRINENYKRHDITIENGLLVCNPKEEFEIGTPFLTLSDDIAIPIMEAMVEGLKKAGYVAEVDNAQRITSEALAKERKEELEYFKDMNKTLILGYNKKE